MADLWRPRRESPGDLRDRNRHRDRDRDGYDHYGPSDNLERDSRRPSPPYRSRAASIANDDRKKSPGSEMKIKGASRNSYDGDQGRHGRMMDRYEDHSRGRDRSYERRPRKPSPRRYRDERPEHRDMSPRYSSRSRSRGCKADRRQNSRRSRSASRDRYRRSSPSRSGRRPNPRRPPGTPGREIILEGLPIDYTEVDISREFDQLFRISHLEDVRVIRDKQTKQSRRFGFVRFPTVAQCQEFVDRHYPEINLRSVNRDRRDRRESEDVVVHIEYSQEREERRKDRSDVEWICGVCNYSNFASRSRCKQCQTERNDAATAAPPVLEYINNGDRDVAPDGTPTQFIILRNLEASVTEELLAKGAAKLCKPTPRERAPSPTATESTSGARKGAAKMLSTTGDTNLGARDGSLQRVILIRDGNTNESWRFGFAEFLTVEDAQAALTRYRSFDKFTISSKPVEVDFIHSGVFVPVISYGDTTNISKSTKADSSSSNGTTIQALGNSTFQLRYWDEGARLSQYLLVSQESKNNSSRQGAGEPNEKKGPTKHAVNTAQDQQGLLGEVDVNDGGKQSVKRRADAKDTNSKPKKAVPAHLQFWSNRHAELHGIKHDANTNDQQGEQGEQDEAPMSKTPVSDNTHREETAYVQSYANPNKYCCYLCSRQFKTGAEVNKHERVSELHQTNLKDPVLIAKATAKLTKAGISIGPSVSTTAADSQDASSAPEYRDRAKERRQAFGSSTRIALPMKSNNNANGKVASDHKSAPDEDSDKEKSTKDNGAVQTSKGASLLGKMGWTAGEGLGASGTGITAPIATDLYVQGVGLGAQGGKVGDASTAAQLQTKNDYGAFVAQTKDKAKARYESMQ